MQAKAVLKHFRQSPRKVRIELDSIRGKTIDKVLNHLHFSKSKASSAIEKIVLSAVSNFKIKNETSDLELSKLLVKECFADGGPHVKDLELHLWVESLGLTNPHRTLLL